MSEPQGKVIVGYLYPETGVKGSFCSSLAALTAYSVLKGFLVGALPSQSGPRIAAGRNNLATSFLTHHNADWLFWLDTDMMFDHDALERLLEVAHPEHAPIVGGHTWGAGRDGLFATLYRVSPDTQRVHRLEGYDLNSLVPVDATGSACLLVHRRVYETLREEYGEPWPYYQETTLDGSTVGEDITFCLRARAAGFPVYVHTGVHFGHSKTRVVDFEEFRRWTATRRFVITGTGRSGTGWAAQVLSNAGIHCGHEEIYGPVDYRWLDWQRGDSSWMAVPYLNKFTGSVFHLVRDPLDTINSFVGIGFFDDPHQHGQYRGFAEFHAPEVFKHPTPVERAMAWWVEWNRRVDEYATARFQIEQMGADQFREIALAAGGHHQAWELDTALGRVDPNYNHRPRAQLTWDDLPDGDLKDQLEETALDYGYTVRMSSHA